MQSPFLVADLFRRAIAHHQQSQLGAAEDLYLQVLKAQPDHFDALHYLGIVKAQQGNNAEAEKRIRAALRMRPNSPDVLSSLGNVFAATARHAEALTTFNGALKLNPRDANVLLNMGNTLCGLKRYEQALEKYDLSLAVMPSNPAAHNNRGGALHELARFAEALESFDRALALAPKYGQALNGRGRVLNELGRFDEAIECCNKAIKLNPKYAEAYNNCANALHSNNRQQQALECYEMAVALKPDLAPAWLGLGSMMMHSKHFDQAVVAFDKALVANPDLDYAQSSRMHAKQHTCDWSNFGTENSKLIATVRADSVVCNPFFLVATAVSSADQLKCNTLFVAKKYPASRHAIWRGERYDHDKIHVTYLSSDFHNHATANLTAGLFEQHDRTRFETSALSFGPDDNSEMRRRIERSFDHFIDVRMQSDRDIGELVRRMQIDIAVDLKGFTLGARTGIFANRAAPLQVSYLGYPGTMAAEYYDYVLADRCVIPEDQRPYYTESVVYLPDCYQVNDAGRRIADRTPTRPEVNLPSEGFVFCSFNNSYKITPEVFDVWMRLLRRTESSVLWLLEANSLAPANLRREAEKRGVAAERLIFAPLANPEDHLVRHRLADLFLDTLPCNAHTTASDALWTGVPIVTCLGSTFAGRVAASLLNAIGLPELVTHSLPDYEALALKILGEPAFLASLKAKLAENRLSYPLFDTERSTRHIEAAYNTMWHRHQQGGSPQSFAVDPVV
jgi:predicted O-linked N-acetylglucosamine transferase (SPINDLY family)